MSVSYGGDSITFADGSVTSSGWTGFKNKIINGSMQVAQRNTSAAGIVASGYYACDRMAYYKNSGNVVVTISQTADGPTGFSSCQKVQTTTANNTIDSNELICNAYYVIENKDMQDLAWGTENAKPMTLSFWVKSNKTGTYTVSPYITVAATSSYYIINSPYTINSADTWEYKTITIPGFTTNVVPNNNSYFLQIYWNARVGTYYTSASAATNWATYTTTNWAVGHTAQWGTSTSDYISLTGIQLERGSTASSFEYRPYGTELALCQRYYTQFNSFALEAYQGAGGYVRALNTIVPLPVEMRATPTRTVITTGSNSIIRPSVTDYSGLNPVSSKHLNAYLETNNTTGTASISGRTESFSAEL